MREEELSDFERESVIRQNGLAPGITVTHLERCKKVLWEDWSNCRDMHHELDTHIAHHEALQAIDITIEIVRKLQDEEENV